ncbi:hypothetical protein GCM10011352_35220 [Marinobacterium zhoushanense]|uniref:Uncharacterized protein n=1 Tax=Marinobacterium zhoushanense TaxID=1679163 RepID=A0ABQ1KRW2_9GAMM|nr:hypothetical protein [Marinobacterium zhoushanense]GGC05965.1 hypothetical protein GCM10011352_35220 [Marinobacterium zhoushanense]
MKTLLSCLLLAVVSLSVQAGGVGPDSSWAQLYQNTMYQPQMPTIVFHARSQQSIGSKLVFKRASNVSYFTTDDGKEWLYGGETSLCTRYAVVAATDDDRVCVATELVPLVTPVKHQARFCTFRSDDDCQRYAERTVEYPLGIQVPIMRRMSESDSFTPVRVAFSKSLKIAECSDCAAKLESYIAEVM